MCSELARYGIGWYTSGSRPAQHSREHMTNEAEDVLEALVDRATENLSVLPKVPTLDNQMIHALCTDLAQRVYPGEEIAKRYGLTGAELGQYLHDHPMLVRRIKEIKAIWESGVSVESKTRTLACHTVLHALPDTGALMFDRTATPQTRLEALKAHARIAGVDGLPPAQKDGGSVGGQFNVIINLPGRVEDLSTTVVVTEVEAIPA